MNLVPLYADGLNAIETELGEPILVDWILAGSGGKKKGKRRERYAIKIDGEYFVVDTLTEAQALLDQALALAKQTAAKAVAKSKPIVVRPGQKVTAEVAAVLPKIEAVKTSDSLDVLIKRAQKRITETYLRAMQDEEEALIVLLV